MILSGKPPGRLAQVAAHHVDDTIGEGDVGAFVFDVGAGEALAHHHQGHVANNLGAWRHFDDIAEHLVHVGVGAGDLGPAFFKPEEAWPVP